MLPPVIPANEEQRIRTLKELHLLDTPAEERFDRITRLAARQFHVPIALLSLMDKDRQWLKSRVGLDLLQIPRMVSFCGHTILGDGVFVVPDASVDPRFSGSPMLTGRVGARFYAGCPLHAPDGPAVGTLSIMDRSPREFSDDDRAALVEFGRLAEHELYSSIELDLNARRAELERMKENFVALVNHELRTPLTSIYGSLGLIAGGAMGEIPEMSKALIGIAHSNSERLVRLINDILDMDRLESGKMEYKLQPLEIQPFLELALELNRTYAVLGKIQFTILSKLQGAFVMADAARIMQIVTNLLSNAAKFSPSGSSVGVAAERRDGMVRVSVSDLGPGVPDEMQGRVFQKFAQADVSNTRSHGGIGLGLAICKALAEGMGGGIGYFNRPGGGATFYFDLPEGRPG